MADNRDMYGAENATEVSPQTVAAINITAEALRAVIDMSELCTRDLYYLLVASAVRIALLAGAPKLHLREAFERALDSLAELPS